MPPIPEAPRTLDFLVSEANGYRSRQQVRIAQDPLAIVLYPGTILYPLGDYSDPAAPVLNGTYGPVTIARAANANAILGYVADIRDGDIEVTAIIRDAEVNKAYLLMNESDAAGAGLPPDAIYAALNNNGIICRDAVLEQSLVAPPISTLP